jgi:hypothetical protein
MPALVNISSAAPNPVVTDPYGTGIRGSTGFINNISGLIGYIVFARA